MNYLCAVSPSLSANYWIGILAHRWGVEDRYRHKINAVEEGDTVTFLVEGCFRSVHEIVRPHFMEEAPLWPSRDGDFFRHRVEISAPRKIGRLSVNRVVESISFMSGKDQWSGTVQGEHGVFNPYLTDHDVELIETHLEEPHPVLTGGPWIDVGDGIGFPTQDLESRVMQSLPMLRLRLFRNLLTGEQGAHVRYDDTEIGVVAQKISGGDLVAIEARESEADAGDILRLLRHMSWVRQNWAEHRGVEGILMAPAFTEDVMAVAGEIRTIQLKELP